MRARNRLEQAGFAHAVGAHHTGHFPSLALHRDVIEDLRVAVVQGEVLYCNIN